MMGNGALLWSKCRGSGLISSDLGYTWLFHIPGVASLFFLACEGVLGDSLEFSQANQGSLCVLFGTRNCSAHIAGESSLTSRLGLSLMNFFELWREPGLYSRVIVGWSFLFVQQRQDSCLVMIDTSEI